MRLDKFLKVTRIIKRRTVAKELADNGNIKVNGEEKKISNPPMVVSNKILIPLKDLVVKILYGNFDYSYNVKEVNISYKGKKY